MWFVATFNTFQPDATKLVPIVVRTNLPYALLRSAPREVRVTTYRCRTTINSLPDLVYVRRDHLHVASTSPYLHVHAIALCPQPLPSPATQAPQLRVQTSCLTPHHTTPHLTAPHPHTFTPSSLATSLATPPIWTRYDKVSPCFPGLGIAHRSSASSDDLVPFIPHSPASYSYRVSSSPYTPPHKRYCVD